VPQAVRCRCPVALSLPDGRVLVIDDHERAANLPLPGAHTIDAMELLPLPRPSTRRTGRSVRSLRSCTVSVGSTFQRDELLIRWRQDSGGDQ
jgi:hypothetical protein